MHIFNFKWFF